MVVINLLRQPHKDRVCSNNKWRSERIFRYKVSERDEYYLNQGLSRKKIMLRIIIVFITCLLIGLVCLSWYMHRKYSVKDAVFSWKAYIMQDNIDYFIIRAYRDYGNGGYYYLNGMDKNPVELTGASPYFELSGCIITEDSRNKFLVKGHIDIELSELAGSEVLVVESWDIIAPIHRAYAFEDPMIRLFSPKLYLDLYDIDSGAYFDVDRSCRAIALYEKEWIKQNSESPCYTVTSDYVEDELQWYIVDDGFYIPISVEGNCPEPHFNKVILAKKYNKFLICGDYDPKSNVLYANEWYILSEIVRSGSRGERPSYFYESRYYFDKFDIQNGIYIP